MEGYLVKPVREDELQQAVARAEEKWKKECMTEAVLSIENIFMACLNGQLSPNPQFNMMTRQRFGLTIEEPGRFLLYGLVTDLKNKKDVQEV